MGWHARWFVCRLNDLFVHPPCNFDKSTLHSLISLTHTPLALCSLPAPQASEEADADRIPLGHLSRARALNVTSDLLIHPESTPTSDIKRIQYKICSPAAIADGLSGTVTSTRFAVLLGSSTLSNIRRVAASLRCMSKQSDADRTAKHLHVRVCRGPPVTKYHHHHQPPHPQLAELLWRQVTRAFTSSLRGRPSSGDRHRNATKRVGSHGLTVDTHIVSFERSPCVRPKCPPATERICLRRGPFDCGRTLFG
ncbi:hypothetical protein C8Q74DRAFT_528636 [Fomes fomentarius]|nr:hypothetical protein C8Q74DRAFT_528636 [Fomes fomentarius]